MDYDERLNLEILNEEASLWFSLDIYGTPTLIVKAPINTVKSIINGCRIEIIVGLDEQKNFRIAHTGIKIFDFPKNPMILSGANRFEKENIYLTIFLSCNKAKVVLYNELGICIPAGNSIINQFTAAKALKLVGDPKELYEGDFSDEVSNSLDCFDYTLDNTRSFKNVYEIETTAIECTFSEWSNIINDFVGLNTQKEVLIGDSDEGSTLESQVWFSIENLFHFNVHLNPKFSTADGDKELTDILAYYELGIFLFETKCLSIFSTTKSPSVERKVKTLQKHIKKAIRQLIGAKNKIQSEAEIYTKKGTAIEFDRNITPHCTVLVAELLPFGNWAEVEKELIRTTIEERIYLHILDFREFISFVKNAQGRKEYLDFLLMQRAEAFIKAKSLHMRSKFKRW